MRNPSPGEEGTDLKREQPQQCDRAAARGHGQSQRSALPGPMEASLSNIRCGRRRKRESRLGKVHCAPGRGTAPRRAATNRAAGSEGACIHRAEGTLTLLQRGRRRHCLARTYWMSKLSRERGLSGRSGRAEAEPKCWPREWPHQAQEAAVSWSLQEQVMQQSPRGEGEGRRSSRSQGQHAGLGQDTPLPPSQGRSLTQPRTLRLGYRGQRVQEEASLPLPFSCGQQPSEQSQGEKHRSRFYREKTQRL